MRLTIKTKLLGSFGLVLTLSAGAGALSYAKLTSLAEAQTHASASMARAGLLPVSWTPRLGVS